MKRVLAFFGAFNPPTIAHIEAARIAMEATGREGVVYVPYKAVYIRDEQDKDFAYSDWQRLEMLRRAAESRPWMAVTDWELRQASQPRTYETLCHLRDEGVYGVSEVFTRDPSRTPARTGRRTSPMRANP